MILSSLAGRKEQRGGNKEKEISWNIGRKQKMAESLSKYSKDDFTQYDQEIIAIECEDCGQYADAEEGECPECGSENVIVEWGMEGIECSGCEVEFGPDEEFFTHDKDISVAICARCFDKL